MLLEFTIYSLMFDSGFTTESVFYSNFDIEAPMLLIHTSGSTGRPKLIYMSAWVLSRLLIFPPQAMVTDPGVIPPPFFMASRAYWTTNVLLSVCSCLR